MARSNQGANTPMPFLNSLAGQHVSVKLKWGAEYIGILKAVDEYMNVQLLETLEVQRGAPPTKLGEIFIRCNNILYIREVKSSSSEAAPAAAPSVAATAVAVGDD